MSFTRRSFLKSSGLALSAVSGVAQNSRLIANPKLDSSMLHFGEAKQFFFDNLLIESAQNLTRKLHTPEKDPRSPLIKKDKPWEHITYFTVSSWRVIRDPEDAVFKCWYEDWQYRDPLKPGEALGDPKTRPSRYLFARSQDGIHWDKPSLGILKENGLDTNIVFGDPQFGSVHSGYVFLDPLEKRRDHRFKIIFDHRSAAVSRYEIASSPDGIHWTPWKQLPTVGWLGPHLGDVLTISVDPYAQIYRLNTRHPRMYDIADHPGDPFPPSFIRPYSPEDFSRQNKRRVFQSQSSDFLRWTNLQPIVVPDDQLDNLDDAFYGMTQMPVGDAWVGFLHVFHMTENTLDVQLLYSRDGTQFQRIQPGQPWLRTGRPGDWDQFMVNIYGEPVVVGDDLYIYYGGANNHHDWWIVGTREHLDVPEARDLSKVNYALGLAHLKVDRFVSLRALAVREGILVTRPFRSQGTRLYINAQCRKAGYVKAAVTDAAGRVLPGFDAESCRAFDGDSVTHHLTWLDRQEIPALKGSIKLQFFLRNADLFSFQLTRP